MEEAKSKRVESRKAHMTTKPPPHGATTPQNPSCHPRHNQNQNDVKKRKLSNTNMEDLQHSPYFKIRALVQQLRPHFIEVTIPITYTEAFCYFLGGVGLCFLC